MYRLFSLYVGTLVLVGCSSSDGTLLVNNLSDATISDVQVNVVRRYHNGTLLSTPIDAFDQIYHTGVMQPGEQRVVRYQSAGEFNIDIRAVWTSGDTARFNDGYVESTFPERHTVDLTSGEIIFDGVAASPIQAFPRGQDKPGSD